MFNMLNSLLRGDKMLTNLKEIRKERNLNQSQLSKISGVSRSIINGLENGKITVTTTGTLQKIAKALNTEVSNFFI